MRNRIFLLLLLLALPFASAKAAVVQKGMGGECIDTNIIHVGDSVVWTNYYDRAYQVTSVDVYDHVDGNFDSGRVEPGGIFTHIFDNVGDFLYFCYIPHQKHAMIKIVSDNTQTETEPSLIQPTNEPRLSGKSPDGSLVVRMQSTIPKQGERMSVQISFAGKYGEPLSDIDYAITASQDQSILPIEFYQRQSDGKIVYNVYSLVSDNPVVIKINLLGVGHPHELTYLNFTRGDTIIFQTEGKVSLPQQTVPSSSDKQPPIPSWIRNNTKWWSEGKIDDSGFSQGINYLISNGVMKITQTKVEPHSNLNIPKWIKNVASWWTDGKISDDDFIGGIQYLVEHGIIRI